MFDRNKYQFFVNMFNVKGKYSEQYAPGWSRSGFDTIENVGKWINQHTEEKSVAKKNKSISFVLPTFFIEKKIRTHVEEHSTTHLLVNWFEFADWSLKFKSNHAIGISIIKDKYDNYHVFYLNKGQRSIKTTWHWFYVSQSQKEMIKKIISAANSSAQEDIEEIINELLLLKNTLSIKVPQPSTQKRGSCPISNSVKNITRVESLMDSIDTVDFRRYLHPDIAPEIDIDNDLHMAYMKKFKEKSYHQAWIGAFEFADIFENATQRKSRLGILLYQGLFNRFSKSHFANLGGHKIVFEIAGIKEFFNRCLEKKYYQSIIIMLIHFAKCNAARRTAKKVYHDCVESMFSTSGKIHLDDELLDMITHDLLADIRGCEFTSAYARFELLDKFILLKENSLYQSVHTAITSGNLDVLQKKLSSPIDAGSFRAFTFLLSIERGEPIKPQANSASADKEKKDEKAQKPLLLHTATEMDKLKTVKYLVDECKADATELKRTKPINDLQLIVLENEEKVKRDTLEEAEKKETPLLIRKADKFTIFGDPDGLNNWEFNNVDPDKADLLSKLPFEEKVLRADDPRFTSQLIETLKIGHYYGQSALDVAAECGHLTTYQYLADHSLSFIDSSIRRASDYQNYNIVQFAFIAYQKKIQPDTFFCLSHKEILDAINWETFIATSQLDSQFIHAFIIFPAVVAEHLTTIKFFIDKKYISIDQKNTVKQQTLLHYAAVLEKDAIFTSLLQYQPDLFAKDINGQSPFRLAAEESTNSHGFRIVLFYLENHFASIPEDDLIVCLYHAVGYGKIDIAELILRQHQFKHDVIQIAFYKAIVNQSVCIARMLISHGAAINEADENGYSAMHMAAMAGGRTLSWVYENNGNLAAKTGEGTLPIQAAEFASVKYLLTRVIGREYAERTRTQPAWSLHKNPVTDLLKKLAELIKLSTSRAELIEKCKEWCGKRHNSVTQLDVLYAVPSIKLALQPLLEPLLPKEVKAEQKCLSTTASEITSTIKMSNN